MTKLGGYMGKMLRVDLSKELITEEKVDETILRNWVGCSGLGVKMIYDEVPPDIEWNDPRNRIIWLTGPLTGSRAPGSGLYGVATKSPLSNRFGVSHANGYFGPRMKFAGFDGVIFQGAAKRWVYLYLHDGVAELRDAAHLLGKDTWETEEMLKKEIGEPQVSVSCIGPAGENLVKYAGICSDRGHICSSNGVGAVAGSKKLKAIVAHGKATVPIHDKSKFTALIKDWHEQNNTTLWGTMIPALGTNAQFSAGIDLGFLPVKNYTAHSFPEHAKFNGDQLRVYYQGSKPHPCYACRFTHCHEIELKSGPHKGEHVEEAEYEGAAAFSSQIGNTDLDTAEWLNNLNDRLGMDVKEQAFVMGLAIECYEKGVLTKKDTDGLELNWGNTQAIETLLHKIARREGLGDVLAEGVMRAAQKIGGDAPKFAVYSKKGHAPHVQDHRGLWAMQFGMAMTDLGAGAAGDMGDLGELEALGGALLDPSLAFSAELVPKISSQMGRRGNFIDCLGVCMFVSGVKLKTVAETASAVTGWDFTWREAVVVADRVANMMRLYNIRCGQTREHDWMSPREYEPPTDGPAKGVSAAPVWDRMLDIYYESMGWDKEGQPLPETLKNLGLESVGKEIGIIK